MWKIIGVDGCGIDIRILICGAGLLCILSRCKTGIFFGVDGEKGMKRIVVVVQFDAIAVEAFNVEQTAVKEFELLPRMVCALREACGG